MAWMLNSDHLFRWEFGLYEHATPPTLDCHITTTLIERFSIEDEKRWDGNTKELTLGVVERFDGRVSPRLT